MDSLKNLLDEYDQLGDTAFSSAHDFTLRQRHLENWAAKARDAIARLVSTGVRLPDDTERPASDDAGG